MAQGQRATKHLPETLFSPLQDNWAQVKSVLSYSVMFASLRPHGLERSRLLCPWNSPGKILEWVAIPFCRGSSQPRDSLLSESPG